MINTRKWWLTSASCCFLVFCSGRNPSAQAGRVMTAFSADQGQDEVTHNMCGTVPTLGLARARGREEAARQGWGALRCPPALHSPGRATGTLPQKCSPLQPHALCHLHLSSSPCPRTVTFLSWFGTDLQAPPPLCEGTAARFCPPGSAGTGKGCSHSLGLVTQVQRNSMPVISNENCEGIFHH